MPHTRAEWATLVAILGTTISPYLFFWQTSEEVEEEKSAGQSTLALRRGATPQELDLRNIDVGVGAFFSNMVMFFIILTTAITLNKHEPSANEEYCMSSLHATDKLELHPMVMIGIHIPEQHRRSVTGLMTTSIRV
jgi:Mn2+/Fe2+ NRAMP family transporter